MSKKVKEVQVEAVAVEAAYDLTDCTTTSAKIRKLTALGLTRGAVAKYLGIRYQHVRNVLITPVKTQK